MSEYKDDLEDLESALAWARSGWHRHENPETGVVAIFPETATDVGAWEMKLAVQTAEAERMERETRPEPKPLENTLARRVQRGD